MDVNGGTIATLGVRVEQTGVNEAKAEVISYGTVGEQSAAKVKAAFDATARSQQVLAGQLNALTQMTQQWNSAGAQAQDMARRIATELAREGEMAGASAAQARQLADAQRVLAGNTEEAVVATEAENAVLAEQAVVSGAAFTGMGRIRQGLVSLVAQSTGTIPVLDRIGVALLGMSIENPVILGVLAGIAAIAFAYKAFAGDTKKAAEEQEHLNKVRQEFLDKQGRPAGELGTSQTQLSDTVNQQRAQLAALTAQRDSLVSDGAIERANTLNEKIIALTKTYDDNANQLKVLTVEKDRLQNAAKEAVAQSALEVEHQAALNAAFGQSAYVIDQINASYKLRSDRIRDAAAATNEEKVKMDALAQAQHDVTVEAARLSTGVAELESKQTELNSDLPSLTAALYDLQPTILAVNGLWADQLHNIQQLKSDYPTIVKDIRDIAAENERAAKAQVNQAAESIKQQQKYSDDIAKIWRDGIAKLTTDGFKSFLDFAHDLEQLFTRLMDRMAARAKELGKEAGGAAYTALGYGAVAVSSGLTGYQIGQSSPSATSGAANGALGGAVTGAAIGSVIPGIGTAIGAIVGGLAGLTGGLLGGAAAARERAKAEEQLRESLAVSTAQIKNQIGLISNLELAQAQAKAQFDKQAADINAAYAGKKNEQERNQLLAQNLAYEQQYLDLLRQQDAIAKQQQKEDLQVRLLRAQGDAAGADALELQLTQERERQALIQSFGSVIDPTEAATLALLDQVQAQEKLAAASHKVASGFLNIEDGLKIMSDRFNAIMPNAFPSSSNPPTSSSVFASPYSPTVPAGASSPSAGASMTVILNMDGREVARGVVKNLQRKASATLGTTIDWSKVSAN